MSEKSTKGEKTEYQPTASTYIPSPLASCLPTSPDQFTKILSIFKGYMSDMKDNVFLGKAALKQKCTCV